MKRGFTIEKKNFHNISLGQGQEQVAEDAVDISSRLGHWVMLQVNIKLNTVIKIINILCNHLRLKERAPSTKMATNSG